jgi:hypothetical protein
MCWWPSWRRDLAPVSGVSSDAYMARHPHPQPQQTDRSAAHAAPGHPGEPRPRQAVIPWAHCCRPAHHQLIRSRLLFARRHRRCGRDSRIGSSNSTRQAGGSCGLWVTTCKGLVFFLRKTCQGLVGALNWAAGLHCLFELTSHMA